MDCPEIQKNLENQNKKKRVVRLSTAAGEIVDRYHPLRPSPSPPAPQITFNVESSAIFVPSFEPDFVAQNRDETFEFFAAALCKRHSVTAQRRKKKRDDHCLYSLYAYCSKICVIFMLKPISSFTVAKHVVVRCLARLGVQHAEFKVDRTFLFLQQEKTLHNNYII